MPLFLLGGLEVIRINGKHLFAVGLLKSKSIRILHNGDFAQENSILPMFFLEEHRQLIYRIILFGGMDRHFCLNPQKLGLQTTRIQRKCFQKQGDKEQKRYQLFTKLL
ncbi:hypothetical protein AVEN_165280-1 [Araneus ventricosus]|uniref:Uncharacterized protein n=1 Tax=Araneus ventricosus TaxID=182803 RepID=A0A4Y2AU57_ARAVE|nr:hypothetical protein AVEN_165280-1 [Araneus ventricosus]